MAEPDAEPSALETAVASLSAFLAAGPPPERVAETIGALVAGWADEPEMSEDVMLDRVQNLWDGFSTNAAALQEQLADTGDLPGGEAARGRRVLAALNAAVNTLAAISSR